jgi:hypothetical protein
MCFAIVLIRKLRVKTNSTVSVWSRPLPIPDRFFELRAQIVATLRCVPGEIQ